MLRKLFFSLVGLFAVFFFSTISANAQVVDAVKDAASKTKDLTVEATKKTTVVVTDNLNDGVSASKNIAEKSAKTTKSFGNRTVTVSENVAGKSYEGRKWATVTTWDGTKWVSKRVWFETKKGASSAKRAVDDLN